MIHARLGRAGANVPALALAPALALVALLVAPAAAAPAPSAGGTPKPPSGAATPVEAPREADRIVRAMEDRLSRAASLAANFTQTFRSAATMQQVVERGRLFVKRPGHMRWDYRQPDKKVFLLRPDGTTLVWIPADYSAVKSRLPADAPHLHLLLGDSRLLDSFAASEVQLKQPVFPGSKQIKLTPRKPADGIEVVYLEIDARTHAIGRVLVIDPMGNESDLVLDKLTEGVRLPDDTFIVRLPPGVTTRDAAASGGR